MSTREEDIVTEANRIVHIEEGEDKKSTAFKHALRVFMNAFAISYGIRGGISLVLHMIKIGRKRPRDLFSIEKLVGENNFQVRVNSVRWALFLGTFSGGFERKSSPIKFI